ARQWRDVDGLNRLEKAARGSVPEPLLNVAGDRKQARKPVVAGIVDCHRGFTYNTVPRRDWGLEISRTCISGGASRHDSEVAPSERLTKDLKKTAPEYPGSADPDFCEVTS